MQPSAKSRKAVLDMRKWRKSHPNPVVDKRVVKVLKVLANAFEQRQS